MNREKLIKLSLVLLTLSAFLGGTVGAQWLQVILSQVGQTHTRQEPVNVINEIPEYTQSSCIIEGPGFGDDLIIGETYTIAVTFSHFRDDYLIRDDYTLEALHAEWVDTLATGTMPDIQKDEPFYVVANWTPTYTGTWIIKFVADNFVWTEIVYVFFNSPILTESLGTVVPTFDLPTITDTAFDAAYYDTSAPATLTYTLNNADAFYMILEYSWEVVVDSVVLGSGSFVGVINPGESTVFVADFVVPDVIGYYDVLIRTTITKVEST